MDYWPENRIIALLLEGGRIAKSSFGTALAELKEDGSLVTQADRAVEQLLREELAQLVPRCTVIGEEGEDSIPLSDPDLRTALEQTAFIVDPIDGTAPYANGLPQWGISIGCARNGVLCEGAIYLPMSGKLYISGPGCVKQMTIVDDQVRSTEKVPQRHRPMDARAMISVSQVLTKSGEFRLSNPVQAVGSAVQSLTGLLDGRYLAYLGCLKLWDLAGGLPLLFRLGFKAILTDGQELNDRIVEDFYHLAASDPERWYLRRSCLFGPPGAAAHLLPHLREE